MSDLLRGRWPRRDTSRSTATPKLCVSCGRDRDNHCTECASCFVYSPGGLRCPTHETG
jgi:hypothetical protein